MESSDRSRPRVVAAMGLLLLAMSCALTWLSQFFQYGTQVSGRPLLTFVTLASAMFVVHLVALCFALREQATFKLTLLIWLVAILSRLVLLPSHPIQEVDLYRYLWDGQVAYHGYSPFQYSPAAVLGAQETGTSDLQLARIAEIANRDPAIGQILRRVHYAEIPTVYPPVSQCTFALVALVVPDQSRLQTHIIAMKTAIVLFDLGVLAIVFWILNLIGIHQAWAIPYAWSPLVLKEFANSGHLDAIAVFFCVTGVAFAMHAIKAETTKDWMVSSACLALGFGAKLFPIVLLPVVVMACFRRRGAICAATTLTVFIVIGSSTLLPIFWKSDLPIATVSRPLNVVTVAKVSSLDELLPPDPSEFDSNQTPVKPILPAPPVLPPQPTLTAPTDGMTTFLSRWEMNDVFFMLLIENLRVEESKAWFSVMPQWARDGSAGHIAKATGITNQKAAFLLARATSAAAFCLVGLVCLIRMRVDPKSFGAMSFYFLAFFWALGPTLNPWYWTWALPLVALAHSRTWLLVGGCVMLYYLRFWFQYEHKTLFGYNGANAFDFVFVFAEHMPWMLAITVAELGRFRSRQVTVVQNDN